MASGLVALIVGALAGAQIVETFRHGSLFAGWRRVAARWAESSDWLARKIGQLLSCPFCLSHWACAATTALLCMGSTVEPAPRTWLVYALAATRLAQILNDLMAPYSRTPTELVEDDDEIPEDDAAS